MLVFGQKMIWFVYPYYGNLITHVSIPFRQAIIVGCPAELMFSACQMLCASCLPPNVCNVFDVGAPGSLVPFIAAIPPDYNCVPTEVNNRLLLYFRPGSAYSGFIDNFWLTKCVSKFLNCIKQIEKIQHQKSLESLWIFLSVKNIRLGDFHKYICLKSLIFEVLYFIKMCPIFVGLFII